MIRSAYVFSTLVLGVLVQMTLNHYLSLYDTSPQILLLLTVTHGFIFGPIMGVVMGFSWGLMSDATGVRLFGMNMFLLALAGYAAGHLRRRVASERRPTQVVIALIVTTYYAFVVSTLHNFFDEAGHRFSYLTFILEAIFNALFVTILFYLNEWWVRIWSIPQEHM